MFRGYFFNEDCSFYVLQQICDSIILFFLVFLIEVLLLTWERDTYNFHTYNFKRVSFAN